MTDQVNQLRDTRPPSMVECAQVVEDMGFCVRRVLECLWRAGLNQDTISAVEDLKKAEWYVRREIQRREAVEVNDGE